MSEIVEKIRKLLAVARNTSGASENEQAQAMKLAQALMVKHGIETVEEDLKKIGTGSIISELDKPYHHIIAHAVGKLYGCRPLFEHRGGRFQYVGREDTRQAAELTVNYVCDQIDLLYRNGLPKGLSQPERSKWRKDFKKTCALRVGQRVEEMIKDTKSTVEATGCTELAIIEHRKQLELEVNDFLRNMGAKTRSTSIKTNLSEASRKGYEAGDKVQVHHGVSSNQLRIAKG